MDDAQYAPAGDDSLRSPPGNHGVQLPRPRVACSHLLGDVPAVNPFSGDAGAPMAAQMAKLLAGSELEELQEIVDRWLAEAPTERTRRQYAEFGAKLLELKRALASAPQQPSAEELELALTMMLKLAAGEGPKR